MRFVLPAFAFACLALGATATQAAPYVVQNCQLNAPADWVASKTRIARADKKVWASLLQAPTAAEIVTLEASFKATKVSEDAGKIVMVSTASAGGLTNKQYHVITKTSPSCLADVTAPAGGADEALAKSVAMTVAQHK